MESELSPHCIYLRKNIHEVTEVKDQNTVTFWEYDEAALTHDEYEEYCRLINNPVLQKLLESNLALINNNTEISAAAEQNNLIIMSAIAELYELMSGGTI